MEFGLKDGVFVGMFIWLLIYVLRTTKDREIKADKREEKLYNFLSDMKQQFAKLVANYENLSKDVTEIKEEINKKV